MVVDSSSYYVIHKDQKNPYAIFYDKDGHGLQKIVLKKEYREYVSLIYLDNMLQYKHSARPTIINVCQKNGLGTTINFIDDNGYLIDFAIHYNYIPLNLDDLLINLKKHGTNLQRVDLDWVIKNKGILNYQNKLGQGAKFCNIL